VQCILLFVVRRICILASNIALAQKRHSSDDWSHLKSTMYLTPLKGLDRGLGQTGVSRDEQRHVRVACGP